MSTPPPGYRTVAVPADRVDDFRTVTGLAFGNARDPEVDAVVPFDVPTDRLIAVEAPDGSYAAVHGSFAFVMPVPGGEVACAGLTWVGVRPDQRRRGLLRSMIATHVEHALGRGEPVSALFAAEAPIYGRFGYGSASDEMRMTLPRRAALRPVAGSDALTVRIERVTPEHADQVAEMLARAGAGRPGWMPRCSPELRTHAVADPPPWRDGAEPLLLATVHDGDDVRGLALFARRSGWTDGTPSSTVRVRQLSALDAAAAHRLWSFLLDLDLTVRVETPALPVDDVLLQLLVDPRPGQRRVGDNLWVRVLDVPAALTARRYAGPLDVVLDVGDALLPDNAGRWRLAVGADGSAEVTRTDRDADVRLDVRELGALYLGGRSASALGAAGLVDGDVPVLDAVTRAFVSPLAPVCPWMF